MEPITQIWLMAAALAFLVLNIVGTVYYTKLPENTDKQRLGLATVLIGWSGLPLANLYSPLVHTK